jgi:type II secretory pathway pseudopilin PulG
MVIISIIAAFGIPNYAKSIGKARARDAINNLCIIHASNVVYKIRNDENISSPDPLSNPADINSKLGLNIIASGGTKYSCDGTSCIATNTTDGFTVTLYLTIPLATGTNPVCVSDSTPSKCP